MFKAFKEQLKRYPILIGIILISLLSSLIAGMMFYERFCNINSTIVTDDLAREQTLEGFNNPKDAVRYLLKAVIANDDDMAMRIFPIDEKCLNIDSAELMKLETEISEDTIYLPSSLYEEYFPVVSVEMTSEYMKNLLMFKKGFSNWENVDIREIGFPQPEEQVKNTMKWDDIGDQWGSDSSCEVMVQLEKDGQIYMTAFTLCSYNGYWKILSFESAFADITLDNPVRLSSFKEFETLMQGARQNEMEQYLYDETDTIKYVTVELQNEETLLPANYVITNEVILESPKELIKEFTKALQKKEVGEALCYIYSGAQGVNTDEIGNKIQLQGKAANEVKHFYYSILVDGSWRKSEKQTVVDLNPCYIPYMELQNIVELQEENKYKAYYVYEAERYEVTFETIQSGTGWQIKDIGEITKLKKVDAND